MFAALAGVFSLKHRGRTGGCLWRSAAAQFCLYGRLALPPPWPARATANSTPLARSPGCRRPGPCTAAAA